MDTSDHFFVFKVLNRDVRDKEMVDKNQHASHEKDVPYHLINYISQLMCAVSQEIRCSSSSNVHHVEGFWIETLC